MRKAGRRARRNRVLRNEKERAGRTHPTVLSRRTKTTGRHHGCTLQGCCLGGRSRCTPTSRSPRRAPPTKPVAANFASRQLPTVFVAMVGDRIDFAPRQLLKAFVATSEKARCGVAVLAPVSERDRLRDNARPLRLLSLPVLLSQGDWENEVIRAAPQMCVFCANVER